MPVTTDNWSLYLPAERDELLRQLNCIFTIVNKSTFQPRSPGLSDPHTYYRPCVSLYMTMTMTMMTMMMVYLTHITGSTVLCVCQHHFELLHTSSTVYHLFSFSMFLQMSLTNMHICFIAFSFVSLLLFGSTLSICLIFSLSVVSLKLLT